MDEAPPSYRREFWKSSTHAWLGLLTLSPGVVTAQPLLLLAGVTAYVLGWIYLPDMGFFRRGIDARREKASEAAAQVQVAQFVEKRDALLSSLSPQGRERYATLAEVCRHIESASADNSMLSAAGDPRMRKLDELMWTFFRLLTIEESLARFLETEHQEDLPRVIKESETEATRLAEEIETAKNKGTTGLETRERFLNSRLERMEVLRKRLQRIEQTRENLALVVSEQERLDQQIKLIRADAVATKNAENLTARIDATVEHLDQTNKWLSEMDEFKDVVGDMPTTEMRIGFDAVKVPPVIQPQDRERASQKNPR